MTMNTNDLDTIVAEGLALHRAGDISAAGDSYDIVLARDPEHFEALHLKGVLLGQTGEQDAALILLDRAVSGSAGDPRVVANRAKLRLDAGDVAGAVEDYKAALARSPQDPDLHFNTAGALVMAGQLEDARALLERAREISPDHARVLANLGNLYRQLGRSKDSRETLEAAVEAAPGEPELLHSLGITLSEGRDYEAAGARFRRALELDPSFIRTATQLFYNLLHACDWRDRDKLVGNFRRLIESGSDRLGELSPLIALFLPVDQHELDAVSDARADLVRQTSPAPEPLAGRPQGERLHIGYLSGDMGRHPVGHLTADLFHRHDRKSFEVSAILLTEPDGSDVQNAVFDGVDNVLDVSQVSAVEAAGKIRSAGVDVLVDLGGFTRGARPEILAARPAPLQVGWLGYCGSSGGLNDVLLVDETVLPSSQAGSIREAVAYLPGTFMPLNNFGVPAPDLKSRVEHGLPAEGMVFCAFNTPTKIDPITFGCWMEILKQVEGSVLWLREHIAVTTRNLKTVAQRSGVDPARLIFAPTVPSMADHLARHCHGDLFLDTFVYGAHSTAADAIAMGVPVLTMAGPAMPSRVGASLCRAYGLSELVVDSADGYLRKAVELAADSAGLRELSNQLNTALEGSRDSGVFVGKLETAYQDLWAAQIAGTLAPGVVHRTDGR